MKKSDYKVVFLVESFDFSLIRNYSLEYNFCGVFFLDTTGTEEIQVSPCAPH